MEMRKTSVWVSRSLGLLFVFSSFGHLVGGGYSKLQVVQRDIKKSQVSGSTGRRATIGHFCKKHWYLAIPAMGVAGYVAYRFNNNSVAQNNKSNSVVRKPEQQGAAQKEQQQSAKSSVDAQEGIQLQELQEELQRQELIAPKDNAEKRRTIKSLISDNKLECSLAGGGILVWLLACWRYC